MRFAGQALQNAGIISSVPQVLPQAPAIQPGMVDAPSLPAFMPPPAPIRMAELKGTDFMEAAAEHDMTGANSTKLNSRGIRGGGKFGGGSGIEAIEDRFMDPLGPARSGTYDPALRSFWPGV